MSQDPFALTTTGEQPLLEVRVNGQLLPLTIAQPEAGEIISIDLVKTLTPGANEIFVQASPPTTEANREQGLRVKVMEEGAKVAETTLWSTPGSLVSGTLLFTISEQETDHHDH
nr:hypothetical protein [uncultured Desulfobulbus sp.]